MAVLLGSIEDRIDKIKVFEATSFAENDNHMYDILMNVYVPAIKRKIKQGKYDRNKAIKLMEYYYTNYVRPEMKKPSKYGHDLKLNPKERAFFGEYFRDVIEAEYL